MLQNLKEIIKSFTKFTLNDSTVVSFFQCNFQEASTVFMEILIDLHHEVMFILILLLCGVLFILIDIIKKFSFIPSNKLKRESINITYSSWLEGLWTIFPLLVLYLLTGPVFAFMYMIESVELLGISNTDINLKVIGNQWYWDYSYDCEFYLKTCLFFFDLIENEKKNFWKVVLDRRLVNFESYVLDTNDLVIGSFRLLETDRVVVLPRNRLINLWITSKDVLHSWAVPSMGIKVDACPGRANFMNLFINRLGRFYGQCSEICGIKHGFMPISIDVCYYKDFVKWFYKNSEVYYKLNCPLNVQKAFYNSFWGLKVEIEETFIPVISEVEQVNIVEPKNVEIELSNIVESKITEMEQSNAIEYEDVEINKPHVSILKSSEEEDNTSSEVSS